MVLLNNAFLKLGETNFLKISHQELLNSFCKYFERVKSVREKKFGIEDKYLENIKRNFETLENKKTPSSSTLEKRRD